MYNNHLIYTWQYKRLVSFPRNIFAMNLPPSLRTWVTIVKPCKEKGEKTRWAQLLKPYASPTILRTNSRKREREEKRGRAEDSDGSNKTKSIEEKDQRVQATYNRKTLRMLQYNLLIQQPPFTYRISTTLLTSYTLFSICRIKQFDTH